MRAIASWAWGEMRTGDRGAIADVVGGVVAALDFRRVVTFSGNHTTQPKAWVWADGMGRGAIAKIVKFFQFVGLLLLIPHLLAEPRIKVHSSYLEDCHYLTFSEKPDKRQIYCHMLVWFSHH